MKAQILKIAGVKSEKEFYKKYPSEAAFMKVHGKAFKKAQAGTAISKAQNFGTLDANNNGILDAMENPGGFNPSMVGQTGNYSNSGNNSAFPKPPLPTDIESPPYIPAQTNPYGNFGPGNVSSFDLDNNVIPDTVQQSQGNPLNKSSFPSPEKKEKPFNVPGLLNFTSGVINAGRGIQAAQDTTKHLETWADVSKVRKKAAISNAFVPEQEREYYRADELKNIYAANELGNTKGRGTDVLRVGQNGSFIGGNPTEIQNMYSNEMTLYDDLGYEPFHETEDDNVKAFQNGNMFGNMLGGGDTKPFLGGSAFGQGGLFGGGNGGASWLAGAMGGNSSYAKAASMIPGPAGMFATMAAQMFDPNPGKQRNAMNTINSNNRYINDIASGKFITRALSNSAVGQNGQNLEMYEEGGYMNPEYNPQLITMFGDHTAEDFADYANKFRAGGHLKSYTEPSERAMETYAMGGKIQSHWGGNVEDESYNPYMPGSGITSMIKGASHKNGGVGISYGGNEAQNGYGYAASGANMGAQIEAEGGESMIEMAEGGSVNPQTGEQETNAVVIGNIPAKYKVLSQISNNQGFLEYVKKKGNDGKTMKSLFADLTKQEVKASKDLEKASELANEAQSSLDKSTAEAIKNSAEETLKMIANNKMGIAESQDMLNKIKEKKSYDKGYNISAEELGRTGKEVRDYDPITKDAPIGNAKSGAYLRKAQAGTTTATEEPVLTQEEYNELVKLYNEGASTSSGKSAAIKNFQRKYHQKFPKEALAAIQKTTKEKGLSNKAKQLGLTVDDILAGKDVQKILESNEDEFWGDRTKQYMANVNAAYNKIPPLQLNTLGTAAASTTGQAATDKKGIDVVPLKRNNAMDALGMISQLFQNRQFPGMDQRQFAGEDMAAALNVQQPVPMQKPYVQLDPIYRMNYGDVRNANTAAFRDMLRQNQGNPAADAMAFANFAKQNQSIGGEEFRTNQAIEQQVYGGNRAKMNANLEKGIGLNIDQANKMATAKSKTDLMNIEIAKSRADKEMKYTADKNKFLTASNLFPKFGYDANYQTQVQGPGYNPAMPQIYGGKASIKQVPIYDTDGKTIIGYKMEEAGNSTDNTLAPYQTPPFVAPTKNGGKVKKNYKNSSVVRAYKNL